MFIRYEKTVTGKLPVVYIEHEDREKIPFMVLQSFKSTLNSYDVFQYLNHYLSTTPKEFNDKLYDLYKEAHELLDGVLPANEFKESLSKCMCSILDSFDMPDMYNWFKRYHKELGLNIPSNCKEVYEVDLENNNRGTREQTYLIDDYIWLIVLALIIRSVLPIWVEYVDRIRNEVGLAFKELRAFELITPSKFYTSEPFEKLKVYIRFNLKPDNYNLPSNLLRGINSMMFFDYLLSLMVIHRLAVKDMEASEPGKNLITYVHQYIGQHTETKSIQGKQVNFIDMHAEDNNGAVSDNPSDKISTLEKYKQKQDVAQGEIVEIEYSISNVHRCAEQLCLTTGIDHNFVQSCIETARRLKYQVLSEPQVTLLKWVFAPVVSPKGIPYVSKSKVIDALGVVQAVLWTRGHKYLALLSTCYADSSPDVMNINAIDSKTRIDKEMIDEINRLYPFSLIRKKGEIVKNLTLKSISSLSDSLSSTPWKYTADQRLVDEVCPGTVDGRLPIELDLKVQLARLVIEIGSRSY